MFLAAMGLGLGGLVEDNGGFTGDVGYLQFVTPGLLAATVMQTASADSLWPIMAGLKWMRSFHAWWRPRSARATIIGRSAHLDARSGSACRPRSSSSSPRSSAASRRRGRRSRSPPPCSPRLAFAAPIGRVQRHPGDRHAVPPDHAVRHPPALPLLRHLLPVDQLPESVQPLAWLSPLWHGVELCRAATTGQVASWGVRVGHVAVLLAYAASGSGAGPHLPHEVGGMTSTAVPARRRVAP